MKESIKDQSENLSQKAPKGPFRACLFDMDGLLINSEDIYTEVTNEILSEHGKGPLPWSVKIKLQGLPGPEAAKEFLSWSKLPFTPEEYFALTSQKQTNKWGNTKFMPGAYELLTTLESNGIPFALATSSTKRNFLLKTAHLQDGFDLFKHHIVTGDDERVPKGRGKPHPDIWLVALESLNKERKDQGLDEILPHECIVFEDGMPGVKAGKAAGAHVYWVPDERALEVLGDQADILIEDHTKLKSLEDFDHDVFTFAKV